MQLIIQIIIGLVGLMLLGLGLKSMFTPNSMVKNFAIEPQGVAGLNTIRGVIGGLFLAGLTMLIAGLVAGNTVWFLAVAILLGGIAIGRIIGLITDGVDKAVIPPLVVELVMVTVLVVGHLQLGAS